MMKQPTTYMTLVVVLATLALATSCRKDDVIVLTEYEPLPGMLDT